MEHDLELIIARLEILEVEVCNIIYNPRYIGKQIFLIQSYPGNIGKRIFSNFPYPGNIGNMIFLYFWEFSKKDARRNFTQNGPVFAVRSHMRPIQGKKLKLFQPPISR